jgi:hypothetical protein
VNYANAQAFAMSCYELGRPGENFGFATYTIVPRIILLNKPSITDVGMDFNYLTNRSANSSSAPGIFAQAYWNGGWLLVVGACLYVEFLFIIFSHYVYKNITNSKFAYSPIILMGIRMGFCPDG